MIAAFKTGLALVVLVGASSMGSALAQGDTDPVPSDAAGALQPPQSWECDLYVQDYREFLKAGNARADWHFAGKRYRSVQTGETYTWDDWLAWDDRTQCGVVALPVRTGAVGGGVDGVTATGIVGGLLGTAAIAAGGDEEPAKSPG